MQLSPRRSDINTDMERMFPWHPHGPAMVLRCQDMLLQQWHAQIYLLWWFAKSSSVELWLLSV